VTARCSLELHTFLPALLHRVIQPTSTYNIIMVSSSSLPPPLPVPLSTLLQRCGSVTVDRAVRPLRSVSETSWREVPALCRHRGRRYDRKRAASRWASGEEETAVIVQSEQHKHQQGQGQDQASTIVPSPPKPQSERPTAQNQNSSQPLRKASMEMSPAMIDAISYTWRSPSKPERKASIDTACEPPPPPSPTTGGLRQPMRKASLDFASSSEQQQPPQNCGHRYKTSDSSSSSCMLDLIYSKPSSSAAVVSQSQSPSSAAKSASSPCAKPERKASMDFNCCSEEQLHEYYGYATEATHDCSTSSSSDGGGCMLDLVDLQAIKQRASSLPVLSGEGRTNKPPRKASLDLCSSNIAMDSTRMFCNPAATITTCIDKSTAR